MNLLPILLLGAAAAGFYFWSESSGAGGSCAVTLERLTAWANARGRVLAYLSDNVPPTFGGLATAMQLPPSVEQTVVVVTTGGLVTPIGTTGGRFWYYSGGVPVESPELAADFCAWVEKPSREPPGLVARPFETPLNPVQRQTAMALAIGRRKR